MMKRTLSAIALGFFILMPIISTAASYSAQPGYYTPSKPSKRHSPRSPRYRQGDITKRRDAAWSKHNRALQQKLERDQIRRYQQDMKF